MAASSRLIIFLKTIRQLGVTSTANFALYKFGLITGHYRRCSPAVNYSVGVKESSHLKLDQIALPDREKLKSFLGSDENDPLTAADQILEGRTQIFGGVIVPLRFVQEDPLRHWTDYERGKAHVEGVEDIKFLWEPARFDWAVILARAYRMTGEERYVEAFWSTCESFFKANPPNLGPQWMSGQEVALRLINLVFALHIFVFSPETTSDRLSWAAWLIRLHAQRIALTLPYAIAQRNNHLISEAAGLITAGMVLPDDLQAKQWSLTGWKWFNYAVQDQIDGGGTYIQHSTNYHRLILTLAIWVTTISGQSPLPDLTRRRLVSATRWLTKIIDRPSGCVPNLGSNDGAILFPLSRCPFKDYRPVLQASSERFIGKPAFDPGPWDELKAWFSGSLPKFEDSQSQTEDKIEDMLRIDGIDSWAVLRAATYHSRPAHADQLNVDLWWRSRNILVDPGTYMYNAPAPWQNSLSGTDVHNTIRIDFQDQMLRTGKFLWLDWAQSVQSAKAALPSRVSAAHMGYQKIGVIHERSVELEPDQRWIITDDLIPTQTEKLAQFHTVQVNWMMPNGECNLLGDIFSLELPEGIINLSMSTEPAVERSFRLVRAGELVSGEGEVRPNWGWTSPSYGQKQPALQLTFTCEHQLPIKITTVLQLIPYTSENDSGK